MTLIELILACAILMVLATAALPLARVTIIRHKEMSSATIFARCAMRSTGTRTRRTRTRFRCKPGQKDIRPTCKRSVDGVPLNGAQDTKIHFLREIPVDPMTGNKDWGMRSVQDDPTSTEWGGTDVFDVFSRSTGTAMDGTQYSEW